MVFSCHGELRCLRVNGLPRYLGDCFAFRGRFVFERRLFFFIEHDCFLSDVHGITTPLLQLLLGRSRGDRSSGTTGWAVGLGFDQRIVLVPKIRHIINGFDSNMIAIRRNELRRIGEGRPIKAIPKLPTTLSERKNAWRGIQTQGIDELKDSAHLHWHAQVGFDSVVCRVERHGMFRALSHFQLLFGERVGLHKIQRATGV